MLQVVRLKPDLKGFGGEAGKYVRRKKNTSQKLTKETISDGNIDRILSPSVAHGDQTFSTWPENPTDFLEDFKWLIEVVY